MVPCPSPSFTNASAAPASSPGVASACGTPGPCRCWGVAPRSRMPSLPGAGVGNKRLDTVGASPVRFEQPSFLRQLPQCFCLPRRESVSELWMYTQSKRTRPCSSSFSMERHVGECSHRASTAVKHLAAVLLHSLASRRRVRLPGRMAAHGLPCLPRVLVRGTRTESVVCFRVTMLWCQNDHGRLTTAEMSLSRSAVDSRLVHDASRTGRGHGRALHGAAIAEVERRHDQHVEDHRRQQAA